MRERHRDSFLAGQYFLGVAGMAAMRRILVRPSEGLPRVADIQDVVERWDEFPNSLRVDVVEYDVTDGYTAWAPSYDGPNPLIDVERVEVHRMLTTLPVGDALDAGCGTGRHAGHLASLGFRTIGVDATAAMLDVARANHPAVDFRAGRMEDLPVDAGSVDVVVSALAVCHAPDLDAVFREFARVVRPGGAVIVSDPHPTTVLFGGVAAFRDRGARADDGFTLPYVENLHHPLHTYLNAAVGAGLEVAECREPTFTDEAIAASPAFAAHPDAVRQAFDGLPFAVVWRFVRP